MNIGHEIHKELNARLLNEVGGTPAFRCAIMLAVKKIRVGVKPDQAAKDSADRYCYDDPKGVEEAIRRYV